MPALPELENHVLLKNHVLENHVLLNSTWVKSKGEETPSTIKLLIEQVNGSGLASPQVCRIIASTQHVIYEADEDNIQMVIKQSN